MAVGSCINTLVSSMKRRRPSRGLARGSTRSACALAGPGSERLRCFKHFLRVPRNLDFAPLSPQHPFGVDQERAAVDAEILPTVEAFLPDDIEELADLLLLVRQQRERQRFLGLEFLVAGDAVAGDADDLRAGLAEGGMQIAE